MNSLQKVIPPPARGRKKYRNRAYRGSYRRAGGGGGQGVCTSAASGVRAPYDTYSYTAGKHCPRPWGGTAAIRRVGFLRFPRGASPRFHQNYGLEAPGKPPTPTPPSPGASIRRSVADTIPRGGAARLGCKPKHQQRGRRAGRQCFLRGPGVGVGSGNRDHP